MRWFEEMTDDGRLRFLAWCNAAIQTDLPVVETDPAKLLPGPEEKKPIEVAYDIVGEIGPAQIKDIRQRFSRERPKAVRFLEKYLVDLVQADRVAYVAKGETYVTREA